MNCTRCNAEAVIKRGNTAYCAKCALARDWEEIVMVVQEDRVEGAAPTVSFDEVADEEPQPKAKAKTGKKGAPKEKAKVAADPEDNGSSELPADPFA